MAFQQAQQAAEKTPAQKAFEARQQAFLDWDNSKDKNVVDAPGMSDYIQIGRAALERANREKMGTGALALTGGGAEGYAEKLRQMNQREQANEFGAGLETALMQRRAEAQGSVMPLAQLNMNRSMGLAGLASQNNNSYLNRPRQQPFWQQLLMGAISGGSAVAGAFAGRPSSGG